MQSGTHRLRDEITLLGRRRVRAKGSLHLLEAEAEVVRGLRLHPEGGVIAPRLVLGERGQIRRRVGVQPRERGPLALELVLHDRSHLRGLVAERLGRRHDVLAHGFPHRDRCHD